MHVGEGREEHAGSRYWSEDCDRKVIPTMLITGPRIECAMLGEHFGLAATCPKGHVDLSGILIREFLAGMTLPWRS